MCGITGVVGNDNALEIAFMTLLALQQRGRESAGMALPDNGGLKVITCDGLVQNLKLPQVAADRAIAHTRYSTTGGTGLGNAQPLRAEIGRFGTMAVAHNGNIVNYNALRAMLPSAVFSTSIDTEILFPLMAESKADTVEEAIRYAVGKIKGAFSLLFLTRDKMIAVRDTHGFRPLILAKLDKGWLVCSETCALFHVGGKYCREIEPGEMLVIDSHGLHSSQIGNRQPRLAQCLMEDIYLARPDSFVFSQKASKFRYESGQLLAGVSPVKADIVIAVPDSGTPAARGYAKESGIPFEIGLYRAQDAGRSFIAPHDRDLKVKMKLTPDEDVLRGQRVVVVEDSLVRGTTSRRIVRMLRDAGAREVHFRVASPPYKWPCFFGIDTPLQDGLVAHQKSITKITKYIDADTLAYLSIQDLLSLVSHPERYCTACFTGDYREEIPADAIVLNMVK